MFVAAIQVGDFTVVGWVTCLLYLVAAALAFRASRRGVAENREFEQNWKIVGAVLFLLGVNKQLDMQTALIELGRRLTISVGLHENRRDIQHWFFVTLLVVLIVLAILHLKRLFTFASHYPACALGTSLVGLYLFIRAASIDHVGQLRKLDPENYPQLCLIEISGLFFLVMAAFPPHLKVSSPDSGGKYGRR